VGPTVGLEMKPEENPEPKREVQITLVPIKRTLLHALIRSQSIPTTERREIQTGCSAKII